MNESTLPAAVTLAGRAQTSRADVPSSLVAAPGRDKPIPAEEFAREPELTMASVLLIVVAIGWLIITRLIVRNLRRAAERGRRSRAVESVRPPRDIWSMPP